MSVSQKSFRIMRWVLSKRDTSNKVPFRIMTFKIREFSLSDSKYYHSDVILNIPNYVIGEFVVFRKLSKAPSKKQAPLPFVKWPKWCFPYNCCQARQGLANILKGKKIFSKNPILGRQVEQVFSSFFLGKIWWFFEKKKKNQATIMTLFNVVLIATLICIHPAWTQKIRVSSFPVKKIPSNWFN